MNANAKRGFLKIPCPGCKMVDIVCKGEIFIKDYLDEKKVQILVIPGEKFFCPRCGGAMSVSGKIVGKKYVNFMFHFFPPINQ